MPATTTTEPKPVAARAMALQPPTPYEDYRRRFASGEKGNLIHGRAILEMSASTLHQDIEAFLLIVLRTYASAKGLGKVLASRVLVKVDDRNGFEPDILFIRQDRLGILGAQDVSGPPDLVVEIVSPSSRKDDRGPKFDGYERLGVAEYWLIDPERREAAVFRLEATEAGPAYRAAPLEDGLFRSTALPGFRFDPQVLFAEPLPSEWDVLRDLLAET